MARPQCGVMYLYTFPRHAPVAQLDRVVASEAIGRGFESLRARHNPSCPLGAPFVPTHAAHASKRSKSCFNQPIPSLASPRAVTISNVRFFARADRNPTPTMGRLRRFGLGLEERLRSRLACAEVGGECAIGAKTAHIDSTGLDSTGASAHEIYHFGNLADRYVEMFPPDETGRGQTYPEDGFDVHNLMVRRSGTQLIRDHIEEAKKDKKSTKVISCVKGPRNVTTAELCQ